MKASIAALSVQSQANVRTRGQSGCSKEVERMRRDRRTEPRHVVIGIGASVDGAGSTIVDLSRSAVRFVRRSGLGASRPMVQIAFVVVSPCSGRSESFRVTGRRVRQTPTDITYRYAAPTSRWEDLLRAHDSFLQTRLIEL